MEGEIWVVGVEIWGVWLLEGGRADSRSVPQTDLGHVKQSRRQAPGDQQQQRALQPRHGVGGAPRAPRRPGECLEPHGTAGGGGDGVPGVPPGAERLLSPSAGIAPLPQGHRLREALQLHEEEPQRCRDQKWLALQAGTRLPLMLHPQNVPPPLRPGAGHPWVHVALGCTSPAVSPLLSRRPARG